MRILIVEDDLEAAEVMDRGLTEAGHECVRAADGEDGLAAARGGEFDVMIVDRMMPRMDGITFARRARERSRVPIVMLTARDLPYDQVAGFEAGADDYVIKPFDGDVLAARLRAVMRRSLVAEASDETVLGDLHIDRPGMSVRRGDERISLSSTEFRLLEAFLDRPGRVLSRAQLLDIVWGDTDWGDPHVVDVNIQRLRAKVGASHIVTVRGAGYKLARE